jgi:hypothetical protein
MTGLFTPVTPINVAAVAVKSEVFLNTFTMFIAKPNLRHSTIFDFRDFWKMLY